MKSNKAQATFLYFILFLLAIVLIAVISRPASITGLNDKYLVGDTITFDFVALNTDFRGTDCVINFDIVNLDENKVFESGRGIDMPLSVLGGVEAYRYMFSPSVPGNYRLTAIYDCSEGFTRSGVYVDSYNFEEESTTFEVIEEQVAKTHSYLACGDSSGTSFDVYWYDSLGIREDKYKDCGSTNICKEVSDTEAVCEGQVVSVDDPVIERFESKCYNGDVYYYNNFGERTTLKQDCADNCINGLCVEQTYTEITGCTPNNIDEQSCDGDNFVKLTCNADGLSYREDINVCGNGYSCDAEKGCIEDLVEVVVTSEQEDFVSACGKLGGEVIDGRCITQTGFKDTSFTSVEDNKDSYTTLIIVLVVLMILVFAFALFIDKKTPKKKNRKSR